MTIENATYLKQLNSSYPEDGDLIKEGDDHIRLIKRTLRNTFKNIDRQVIISAEQLNELVSYKDYVSKQIETVYPIGSIYTSVNNANPSTVFGFGTWEAVSQGRVLVGAGDGTDSANTKESFTGGSTGGEYYHKLTPQEMPLHNHDILPDTRRRKPWKTSSYTGASISLLKEFSSRILGFDLKEVPGGKFAFEHSYTLFNHDHSVGDYQDLISNNGSDVKHNNIQPYLTVYMWKRTA